MKKILCILFTLFFLTGFSQTYYPSVIPPVNEGWTLRPGLCSDSIKPAPPSPPGPTPTFCEDGNCLAFLDMTDATNVFAINDEIYNINNIVHGQFTFTPTLSVSVIGDNTFGQHLIGENDDDWEAAFETTDTIMLRMHTENSVPNAMFDGWIWQGGANWQNAGSIQPYTNAYWDDNRYSYEYHISNRRDYVWNLSADGMIGTMYIEGMPASTFGFVAEDTNCYPTLESGYVAFDSANISTRITIPGGAFTIYYVFQLTSLWPLTSGGTLINDGNLFDAGILLYDVGVYKWGSSSSGIIYNEAAVTLNPTVLAISVTDIDSVRMLVNNTYSHVGQEAVFVMGLENSINIGGRLWDEKTCRVKAYAFLLRNVADDYATMHTIANQLFTTYAPH
jgi:hypothetical protein